MSTLEKYSKDTDRSLSVDSGLEVGDGEKATQETDVIGELKSLYMSQMLYAGQSAREIVTFLSDF